MCRRSCSFFVFYSDTGENHSIIFSTGHRPHLNFFILAWSLASLLFPRCCCERSCSDQTGITREPWAKSASQSVLDMKTGTKWGSSQWKFSVLYLHLLRQLVHLVFCSSSLSWSLSSTFPIKLYNALSLLINWTALSINLLQSSWTTLSLSLSLWLFLCSLSLSPSLPWCHRKLPFAASLPPSLSSLLPFSLPLAVSLCLSHIMALPVDSNLMHRRIIQKTPADNPPLCLIRC